MRVDQGGKRLFLRIQLLQEKTGGAELVLVRRILQQFDGFLAGDLNLVRAVAEREVAERFDRAHVGGVIEAPLIGRGLGDDDVGKFLSQHGGQAGFIGKNVEQPAAENDGVAYGKRFERAGEQNAAMNFGLDIEVVGNFQVVDDGLKDLVDF